MNTLNDFKKRVEISFSEIKSLDDLRKEDEMVNQIFKISRQIFDQDLDRMNLNWLVSRGGRLASIYAYLGNKSARSRAERDIYEQQRDEILNRLTIEYYNEADSKITLARAKAKQEVFPIEKIITIKEYEYKSLENLLNATERLVGFIQSAIKVKQSENFNSRDITDNA